MFDLETIHVISFNVDQCDKRQKNKYRFTKHILRKHILRKHTNNELKLSFFRTYFDFKETLNATIDLIVLTFSSSKRLIINKSTRIFLQKKFQLYNYYIQLSIIFSRGVFF